MEKEMEVKNKEEESFQRMPRGRLRKDGYDTERMMLVATPSQHLCLCVLLSFLYQFVLLHVAHLPFYSLSLFFIPLSLFSLFLIIFQVHAVSHLPLSRHSNLGT